MRRDRRAPALYELIRGATQPPATPSGPAVPPSEPAARPAPQPAPRPQPVDADAASEPGPLFAGPGRVIAVPVGYFWIGAAAAVLLLIAAYVIGYKQHEREAREALHQESQQQFEGVVDPTNTPAPPVKAPVNPGLITQTPPNQDALINGSRHELRLVTARTNADDPREPGLNYFIVANLPRAESERAGQFLVSKGVAAMLAPADNRGFCQVVALRGFPAGTLDEKECVQYKERLRSIGREYKRDQKGPTDFADLFPKKHRRE